jgi:hypothetical protein
MDNNMDENTLYYGLGAAYLVVEVVKYLLKFMKKQDSNGPHEIIKTLRRNQEMIHDIKESFDRMEPNQLETLKLLFRITSNMEAQAKSEERIVKILDKIVDKLNR